MYRTSLLLLSLLSAAPTWAAEADELRPAYACETCNRWQAFKQARESGDVAAADALIPALLKDGKRGEVAEYLIFDRGRCTEALALLERERQSTGYPSRDPKLLAALACEAARLEAMDLAASTRLLAEAIDREMAESRHDYQSDLFHEFAWRAALNEPVLRFLIRHQLDASRAGYAIESQIENGRVDNVRRLLALGTDPNEMHGGQHAALGEALDLLETKPEVALEITEVLLAAGADPAFLMDYSEEPERSRLRAQPARQRFNAILSEANARLARNMPVRIQFYDLETPYARIDVFNRSGKAIVLDTWRDARGFEYGGEHATFEFRFAPGTQWIPYEFGPDGPIDHKCMRRVLFQNGDRTMLRVPFDPSMLARSPPGLQVRLRISSAGGIDYFSVPFALHDNGTLRGAWPRDPSTPESPYFASGTKLDLPQGLPKATEEGADIAPHSHPGADPDKSCPKS